MRIDSELDDRPRHRAAGGLAEEDDRFQSSPYRKHHFNSLNNRTTRTLSYAFVLLGVSAIAVLVLLLVIWYLAALPQ
ncbi:MAG: hypothetical protein ACE5Q6_12810 [Dehalococcoidia bacterium]